MEDIFLEVESVIANNEDTNNAMKKLAQAKIEMANEIKETTEKLSFLEEKDTKLDKAILNLLNSIGTNIYSNDEITIENKTKIRATIPPVNTEVAVQTLKDKNYGSFAVRKIIVNSNWDDNAVTEVLDKLNVSYDTKLDIHHNTLNKIAKEYHQTHGEYPKGFSVFEQPVIVVKLAGA